MFRATARVQMADSHICTANSLHLLTVGAKLGPILMLATHPVNVSRDNKEAPDLVLTAQVNETQTFQDK